MPFFLNFAGKRKAVPVFSVFGCAHRSCGGSVNPEVKNFYDFTPDDVKLIDYETHEQIKNIPVAV